MCIVDVYKAVLFEISQYYRRMIADTNVSHGVDCKIRIFRCQWTLNQLSQSFAICAKQYNIYLAQNGRAALEVLKTSKVNILLTALNIPVTHDFELPDYTTIYYPATRIFVMAEDDPSTIKNRLDDLRISGYIRKPLRIEMIYSILRV